MLNTDENQDPRDDKLSPAHRRSGGDEESDDLSPEKVGDMEQAASSSGASDSSSIQDKAEKDKVSSQTSDEPDFFNQGARESKGRRFRAALSSRRKKATFSLAAILLVGGGFGIIGFLQGPAQLLNLDAALKKPESAQSATVGTRLRRMVFRSTLNNGNDQLVLARSRLGTVQNRVFGGMLDRLKTRHGITFTEQSGIVTGRSRPTMVFDLPDGHPLRGSTDAITKSNIAKAFGINESRIPDLDGSGRLSLRLDLSRAELDGVKTWVAHNTGGGSVTKLNSDFAVAVNKRMFAKVLRLPSLFHPISRISEAIGTKLDNLADKGAARRARKQEAARTRLSDKVEEKIENARSDLRSKVGTNLVKGAATAVALQGVMCMVKDIAGIVPRVYYATVVMPSVLRTVQTQGAISQIMSGEDITSEQVGDVMADLRDSSGGSVWGAKPLDSLVNGGEGRGTDINVAAKSAFTTQGSSISDLVASLGLGESAATSFSDGVADWACTPLARIGGLIVGFAITVGGIVSGVATGLTTTAGAVGRVAVQAAIAGTVSYAASKILGEFIEGKIKDKVADSCGVEFDSGEGDKPEDIEVLDAKAYGSCMAYAARMSSNINAASMGGVPISSSDELALLNQADEQEIAEFKQKGLFERLFSTKDRRSLIMTALRPSAESELSISNFASMVTGLFKKPASVAGGSLSALTPSARAATTYDWGFPLVSMPQSIAEDPQYDSVENVQWITDNRASVDTDRVKRCFGKEVVGTGPQLRAVLLADEVNPLSDDYNDANCGDLSNPDWVRTALFVMDDSIAATMDCYDGANETCAEIGINGGDTTDTGGFAGIEDLNCDGYDKLSSQPAVIVNGVPTNKTQVAYNETIRSTCAERKAECLAGASGTIKALCAAFEFNDVYYGSTTLPDNGKKYYGFVPVTNGLRNPADWLEKRQPGLNPYNVLECSGLTTVAVYKAFNYTSGVGCSGRWGQHNNPGLFKEIPASQLQPGDFITTTIGGCAVGTDAVVGSHIAIVASAPVDGKIVIYEESSHGTTSHFRLANLSTFANGNHSRWIGPGL